MKVMTKEEIQLVQLIEKFTFDFDFIIISMLAPVHGGSN